MIWRLNKWLRIANRIRKPSQVCLVRWCLIIGSLVVSEWDSSTCSFLLAFFLKGWWAHGTNPEQMVTLICGGCYKWEQINSSSQVALSSHANRKLDPLKIIFCSAQPLLFQNGRIGCRGSGPAHSVFNWQKYPLTQWCIVSVIRILVPRAPCQPGPVHLRTSFVRWKRVEVGRKEKSPIIDFILLK